MLSYYYLNLVSVEVPLIFVPSLCVCVWSLFTSTHFVLQTAMGNSYYCYNYSTDEHTAAQRLTFFIPVWESLGFESYYSKGDLLLWFSASRHAALFLPAQTAKDHSCLHPQHGSMLMWKTSLPLFLSKHKKLKKKPTLFFSKKFLLIYFLLLFKKYLCLLFWLFAHMYVCVVVCTHACATALDDQKVLAPLELVVSCLARVLGTELESSRRAASALNHQASSSGPLLFFTSSGEKYSFSLHSDDNQRLTHHFSHRIQVLDQNCLHTHALFS